MTKAQIAEALAAVYDPLEEIDRRAIELNVKITDLARISGVHYATIYRWFRQPPAALETTRRIIAVLDLIEAEQIRNHETNNLRPGANVSVEEPGND